MEQESKNYINTYSDIVNSLESHSNILINLVNFNEPEVLEWDVRWHHRVPIGIIAGSRQLTTDRSLSSKRSIALKFLVKYPSELCNVCLGCRNSLKQSVCDMSNDWMSHVHIKSDMLEWMSSGQCPKGLANKEQTITIHILNELCFSFKVVTACNEKM